jgi:hypothetical protein
MARGLAARGRGQGQGAGGGKILICRIWSYKKVERAPCNMVRGQSWRALSGVAGTRRLLADMKAAQRPVRA